MSATAMRESKHAIVERRKAYEREERDARNEALREHNAKFNSIRNNIFAECEDSGGHEWIDLPDNGSNSPHFLTGEWPMACKWCRKHRLFGWTEDRS